MIFVRAFDTLRRNPSLLLYPALMDSAGLAAGWLSVGFIGTSQISVKLILDMGLPSLGHLINVPIIMNSPDFLSRHGGGPVIGLVTLLFLLLTALMQGGYIASLDKALRGERRSFRQFLKDGRRAWVRFILFYIIVALAKTAATTLLVLIFGAVGLFASLVLFLALRIRYIYLELAMVVDHLNIDTAMRRSPFYWKEAPAATAAVVGIYYAVSALFSLLLHAFWYPLVLWAGVWLYAFVMTAVQLSFMLIIHRVREDE